MRKRWALMAMAVLCSIPGVARAGESSGDAAESSTERRLEEVLAELEAQRLEIDSLKAQLGTTRPADAGVEDAVKKYLESDSGMKLLGKSKDLTMKIGGRMHYDMIFPRADGDVETAVGPIMRTNRFRRARLQLSGTIHKSIFYSFQLEMGASPHTFGDMFMGVSDLPVVGKFQVGVFKEPFLLEALTSANYITFMERSSLQTFSRGRIAGAMIHDSAMDGNLHWALAVGGDHDGRGTGTTGNNIIARVAGTPWNEDGGRKLLHLGVAFQHRDPELSADRLRSRPAISTGPNVLDTGALSMATSRALGLEAATVAGPFSFQAEYVQFAGRGDVTGSPDPRFRGYYGLVSYFLTGEHRAYKNGVFERVKPNNNYGSDGGSGAWEVAARYGDIDLQDDGVAGGGMKVIELGLNWYLNPNARVMLQYGMADVDALGDVKTIALRFQIDF